MVQPIVQVKVPRKAIKELGKKMKRLDIRTRRLAINRSLRDVSKPIISDAQRFTPVESGALRESLGAATSAQAGTKDRQLWVGPRRRFKQKNGRSFVRGGFFSDDRQKVIDEQLAKGGKLITNPSKYGYGIETGVRKNGQIARRKGGAWMLRRGLMNNQGKIESIFVARLRQEIERATT